MAADTLQKAAEQAIQLKAMDIQAWRDLAISFGFGGGTSLAMGLREGKLLTGREILSSAILSGMIATGTIGYLLSHNLPAGMTVAISIACGLGGDGLVKAVARLCVSTYRRFFGTEMDAHLHHGSKSNRPKKRTSKKPKRKRTRH